MSQSLSCLLSAPVSEEQEEQARPGTHLHHVVNGYSETSVDRTLASLVMLIQSIMSALDHRIQSRWDDTGLCRSEQCERA